jgi:hypothetical protein
VSKNPINSKQAKSLQHPAFLKIIPTLILFTFISWYYLTYLQQVSFHPDEHEFLRKSFYYDLFFIRRDFKDPRWTTQDSYAQPKLEPYIYGLTLSLQGVDNIEAKLTELNFGNHLFSYVYCCHKEVPVPTSLLIFYP